jgi:hypothetical protein
MKTDQKAIEAQPQSLDWSLWFYWIIATTSGWLIGSLFFAGIPIIFAGVLISAIQWAVFYKRIERSWQWFILSSTAWIISVIIFVLFLPVSDFIFAPFLGTMLGITQWAILRKVFYWAGWWIPISILAWTTGFVFLPGLFTTGALPGALTGLTLVILFRFAAKDVTESEVNNEISPPG